MAQVNSEDSIGAPARLTRARKSSRPLPVRPRFKNNATAGFPARETVLPPPIEHLATHTAHRFDAAAYAASRGHPLALLIQLRQEAADQIEYLLQFLDETSGDEDCEAGDEPTDIEIREAANHYGTHHDDDEDGADGEPALGWTRTGAIGNSSDLEEFVS